MKNLLFVVGVMLFCASFAQEITFDRPDREYRTGENVTVTVKFPEGDKGKYRLVYASNAKTLYAEKGNPVKVTFPVPQRKGVNNVLLQQYQSDGKLRSVGRWQKFWCDGNTIFPAVKAQGDFLKFWNEILKNTRKKGLDPQLMLLPKFSKEGAYKVYKVSLNGPMGRIYGFLNVPEKIQGKAPAKMTVCWAGAGWRQIPCRSDKFIILAMNIHTFDPDNTKEAYETLCAPHRQKYKCRETYMYLGLPERDNMYYIHGIAGNVLALEWLASLPEVDASRIGYFGTSQGGGFGLFLGGLSDKLAMILCDVPAMCDHSAYLENRSTGFPWYSNRVGKTPQIQKALSYIDGASFAPYIKSRIRVLAGEYDEVCYPMNIRAAYNMIPASTDKKFYTQFGGDHSRKKDIYKNLQKEMDDFLTGKQK